jgi:energy-coupling factor transport system permease protein
LSVAIAVTLLAFLVPTPWGPVYLYLVSLVVVAFSGVGGAIRQALVVCLPLWLFLFVLHGLLGGGPKIDLGLFALSAGGATTAVAQAGRFGAIITISLGFYHAFNPSRFLNAVAARGWPMHFSYLFVATLHALPAFVERASTSIEAQRTRGLRFSGGVLARTRAVVPLALPLILGALAEVDDRAHALEMRAVAKRGKRTPLDPPTDSWLDRTVRWTLWVAIAALVVWRVMR